MNWNPDEPHPKDFRDICRPIHGDNTWENPLHLSDTRSFCRSGRRCKQCSRTADRVRLHTNIVSRGISTWYLQYLSNGLVSGCTDQSEIVRRYSSVCFTSSSWVTRPWRSSCDLHERCSESEGYDPSVWWTDRDWIRFEESRFHLICFVRFFYQMSLFRNEFGGFRVMTK